jgi:NADP-reducing hydrogenase subunit HndD
VSRPTPYGSPEPRTITLTIDGAEISAPEGSTILDACRLAGIDIPTLCYLETLTPVNACRVCVVEVVGSRMLVPACSRSIEEGMVVNTGTERADRSRRMVLELLASSVDLSLAGDEIQGWMSRYDVDAQRFGPHALPSTNRDRAHAGRHSAPALEVAQSVAQPIKRDNQLYLRDYSKCILCYKCVEACGPDAQNTFAIAVAGRGFEARISTEYDVPLTESACVYCGNCIAVCPTGALMFTSEYDMRDDGSWNEAEQTVTRTVCPYCGVGCNLELHVQDNRIVKVTSPLDHDVTSGNLCIKGRFGFEYVQQREAPQS